MKQPFRCSVVRFKFSSVNDIEEEARSMFPALDWSYYDAIVQEDGTVKLKTLMLALVFRRWGLQADLHIKK